MFLSQIDLEEYGNALSLAKAYNLDCDLVYQRQWRKTPVSVASIQDYLVSSKVTLWKLFCAEPWMMLGPQSKIGKRAWVLRECLERVPEDYDAMRELLHYGLRGTDLQALIAIGEGTDHGRFILCDSHDEDDLEPLDHYDPAQVAAAEEAKAAARTERQQLLEQVNFIW